MTLEEAAKKRIERVRLDIWSNKNDYLKLTIIDEKLGPILKLYSPTNKIIGEKNPQLTSIYLGNTLEVNGFVEYKGEIDPDENPDQ